MAVCVGLLVLAGLAARGSVAAHLGWLGLLGHLTYSYVLDVMFIHFGASFPWGLLLAVPLLTFGVAMGVASSACSSPWTPPPSRSRSCPRC